MPQLCTARVLSTEVSTVAMNLMTLMILFQLTFMFSSFIGYCLPFIGYCLLFIVKEARDDAGCFHDGGMDVVAVLRPPVAS